MITKNVMVTLAGRPNVGKSTLTNALVGEKISIVSNKPQTTRNRIFAVLERGETQIVLTDTPGFHRAKNRLGDFMVKVVEESVADVDVVALVVEPVANIGDQEEQLIAKIKATHAPSILVINKIDRVKKEEVLTFIDAYRQILDFAEIVPVSALKGTNTDTLVDVIFKYLPYGPMFYDEDTVTDQPLRQITAELIREKALKLLDEEIPHGIAVSIEQMKPRPNGKIWDIEATIVCERDSHKGIIIGKGGAMLKKIGSAARYEIERQLDAKVNLRLWVKVKKDWRDSDFLMKNFGYDKKEV